MTAKAFLYKNLKNDFENLIGPVEDDYLINIANSWMDDDENSTERFNTHQLYFPSLL